MRNKKIFVLMELLLLASFNTLPADSSQSIIPSRDYIHPPLANHVDSPLPELSTSDHIVGIYGNILYPQDQEQLQQKKLNSWIDAYAKDPSEPFPLSAEEINDISLFILDRFPIKTLSHYFVSHLFAYLKNRVPFENALDNAKQETLLRSSVYREIARSIPLWNGRCEVLAARFIECADQTERIIDKTAKIIRDNPEETLQSLIGKLSIDLIEPPFIWNVRVKVFKQLVDKVISLSPNSPYFLALQEVTPQALNDLKITLADRNLQWISFNNISRTETLKPRQEMILGEATGFTSTLAVSRNLQILKIELGDLPTESGSVRKILGVRVLNTRTNEVFNLFTTHTDHQIQNDIYKRTAEKIHEFATRFFQDTPNEQRFVLGGDLNAFEQSGGDRYLQKLRELFPNCKDFRETNYYAPNPIAWSSFIGRSDDTFSGSIASDGIVEPNALDHVLVGNGIELQSAAREATVYNTSGELLDYYKQKDEYMTNLKNRVTFSDHFFSIIRFK